MSHLENISATLELLTGAYAENTLKSYYADTNAFVDWCFVKNIEPFPLTSGGVREYIEAMAVNYSYASIRRRLSCIRRINKLLGHTDNTQTQEIYLAIRRLKRSKCLEQQQAVGINHNLLVKMIDAQPNTLAGIRNKAMLSLGYDFLARRSELVALRTSDLEFTKDGALKGMIRKSKTDQYGRGRLVFGSERGAKLLRGWFRKKPKEIEAVFCAINHGVCMDRPICDRNVNEIIKKSVVKVKRCERPSDLEVSGHSLRVGAAQDLLIKGYDLAAIMRAGGWSDPSTVSRYLRFSQHNIWK
ncbi:tyrosine-type recombinase/integrase [Paracoccaceae bacterium]|nr:tyrosine-type recombinase/integrase [Paracoccaceae bacterium]